MKLFVQNGILNMQYSFSLWALNVYLLTTRNFTDDIIARDMHCLKASKLIEMIKFERSHDQSSVLESGGNIRSERTREASECATFEAAVGFRKGGGGWRCTSSCFWRSHGGLFLLLALSLNLKFCHLSLRGKLPVWSAGGKKVNTLFACGELFGWTSFQHTGSQPSSGSPFQNSEWRALGGALVESNRRHIPSSFPLSTTPFLFKPLPWIYLLEQRYRPAHRLFLAWGNDILQLYRWTLRDTNEGS